jgi:hypothetical protein
MTKLLSASSGTPCVWESAIIIVALSFRDWLMQHAEGLASGKLIISDEHNCIVNADDM